MIRLLAILAALQAIAVILFAANPPEVKADTVETIQVHETRIHTTVYVDSTGTVVNEEVQVETDTHTITLVNGAYDVPESDYGLALADMLYNEGWRGVPGDGREALYPPVNSVVDTESNTPDADMIQVEDGTYVSPEFFQPNPTPKHERTCADILKDPTPEKCRGLGYLPGYTAQNAEQNIGY